MIMQDVAALLLALVSGASFVLGLVLLFQPRVNRPRKALVTFGFVSLLMGLGGFSRSLAFLFAERGWDSGDILFRLQYVLWLMASGLGPLSLWRLDPRKKHGVISVAVPLFAVLLAIFVFTPAFIPFEIRSDPFHVEPYDLTVRWAFLLTVGYIALVSGCSTIQLLVRVLAPGNRTIRAHCLFTAVGYGIFTVLVPLAGAMDAGLSNMDAGIPLSTAVLLAWLLANLGHVRANTDDMIRTVRHLRTDLDRQYAHGLRDPLTGLFNRGYFFEVLNQAHSQLTRDGEIFAMCMLDLDNFKNVNDTHGHQVGDLVLQEVAKIVMRGCRPYDTAARYGGEEFIVLFRGIDIEGALGIAERLRVTIGETRTPTKEGSVRVTATFGMVAVVEPPESLKELVARVDSALYEGKRMGKNQVRVIK
ncbi:MAG: GGDEF domain-containing protein [Deltaproteobacteria bacterium]|nr:GGDEF domain-containing protein [Deltaproteobacteria bacterium]